MYTVFLCYAWYRILWLRVREFSAVAVCGVARSCGVAGFVLPQLQCFGPAVGQFQLVWTRKDNFNWKFRLKRTGITPHLTTTFNQTTLDPPLLRFSPVLNNQHVQIPIRCRTCVQSTGDSQEGHRSTSSCNCQMSPSLNTVCFCFCLFE